MKTIDPLLHSIQTTNKLSFIKVQKGLPLGAFQGD